MFIYREDVLFGRTVFVCVEVCCETSYRSFPGLRHTFVNDYSTELVCRRDHGVICEPSKPSLPSATPEVMIHSITLTEHLPAQRLPASFEIDV
jgi:hypothetical protein